MLSRRPGDLCRHLLRAPLSSLRCLMTPDVVVAPSHKGRGHYYGAYLISVVTWRGCGARGARPPTALLVRGGPAADRADPRRASELLTPSRRTCSFLSLPHPGEPVRHQSSDCFLIDAAWMRAAAIAVVATSSEWVPPSLPLLCCHTATIHSARPGAKTALPLAVSPPGRVPAWGCFSWTRRTIDR